MWTEAYNDRTLLGIVVLVAWAIVDLPGM